MPSSFLQPHTFFLHFYSFVFPCWCFIITIISSQCSAPHSLPRHLHLPHSIPGVQSPFHLPSSPSASRTTRSLPPSAPGIVPRGSSKAPEPESLSSPTGFLQRNPSPAYFGVHECLTLVLGRKPKATQHFVSLHKMVLLGCLISPHCSPLLPPKHITFQGWVTEAGVVFEEEELLLSGVPGLCAGLWAQPRLGESLQIWRHNLHCEQASFPLKHTHHWDRWCLRELNIAGFLQHHVATNITISIAEY